MPNGGEPNQEIALGPRYRDGLTQVARDQTNEFRALIPVLHEIVERDPREREILVVDRSLARH